MISCTGRTAVDAELSIQHTDAVSVFIRQTRFVGHRLLTRGLTDEDLMLGCSCGLGNHGNGNAGEFCQLCRQFLCNQLVVMGVTECKAVSISLFHPRKIVGGINDLEFGQRYTADGDAIIRNGRFLGSRLLSSRGGSISGLTAVTTGEQRQGQQSACQEGYKKFFHDNFLSFQSFKNGDHSPIMDDFFSVSQTEQHRQTLRRLPQVRFRR